MTIPSSGTFSTKFQVDNSNLLLLLQVWLPGSPGEYKVDMSGKDVFPFRWGSWGESERFSCNPSIWKQKLLINIPTWRVKAQIRRDEIMTRLKDPVDWKLFSFITFHRQPWSTLFSWRRRNLPLVYVYKHTSKLVIDTKPTKSSKCHWKWDKNTYFCFLVLKILAT